MKHEHDNSTELSRDEQRFIRQVGRSYAPDPLTGARRTAFDAQLRERLAGRSRLPGWLPALAATGCTAVLAWVVLGGADTFLSPTGTGQDLAKGLSGAQSGVQTADASTAERPELSAWEEELWHTDLAWSEPVSAARSNPANASSEGGLSAEVLDDPAVDLFEGEDDEFLSSEYAAIDDLFLEYVDDLDG